MLRRLSVENYALIDKLETDAVAARAGERSDGFDLHLETGFGHAQPCEGGKDPPGKSLGGLRAGCMKLVGRGLCLPGRLGKGRLGLGDAFVAVDDGGELCGRAVA